MGRKRIGGYVVDEHGNAISGTSQNLRVYELDADNKSTDTLAQLFLAQTGADEITNDGTFHPYSGQETTVRVEPGTTDTLIDVVSTTGLQVADVIRFFSGSTVEQRTIEAITDADTLELTEQIGFAFPVGSTVGNEGGTGYWEAWVDDGKNYEWSVENDATGEEGERQPVYVQTPATAWQDEGIDVASRSKLNVISPHANLTDDAGNSRVDLNIPQIQYSELGGTHGNEDHATTFATLDDIKKWGLGHLGGAI